MGAGRGARAAGAAAAGRGAPRVAWVRPAEATGGTAAGGGPASPFVHAGGAAGAGAPVPWGAALAQLGRRLAFAVPGAELVPVGADMLAGGAPLPPADLVLGAGLGEAEAEAVRSACVDSANVLFFQSWEGLPRRLGGVDVGGAAAAVPWTRARAARDLAEAAEEIFQRATPDDALQSVLKLVDAHVAPVEAMRVKRDTGPRELWSIVSNCGGEVLDCVRDPECKAALDCLTECEDSDQVAQYRCIASYESDLFTKFSQCILQTHNCLDNKADIPAEPRPPVMPTFRGAALTHAAAYAILRGHLETEMEGDRPGSAVREASWRVVAGQNAAYDAFPCQYQLFYPGRGKTAFWYDPVFKVQTLDNREVWRSRHYRVQRGKSPGHFTFTVLDNGVLSREEWRIIHCEDDLSWVLFFYSGAASAAGLSYTGAILASRTGEWPGEEHQAALEEALERASLKPWELYNVDNCSCSGAPLRLETEMGEMPQ